MEATVEAPSRKPWNSTTIPGRVRERAATRWVADLDCRISTYSVASHGYAQVGWSDGPASRHVVLAHRASWEHSMGPVPIGYTIDHLCKQKRCVNPAHLRILSNFENARRVGGMNWQLGTCANGHPDKFLVDDPHRRTKSGAQRTGKRCSECMKLSYGRSNWRNRHPGDPVPEHLLLSSEKINKLSQAA